MSEKSGTIISKDEGSLLRAFGDEIVIHLDGERTGERLTMRTGTLPPGGGPRCAEEFAKPDGPDMSRVIEIGTEHGIHFIL